MWRLRQYKEEYFERFWTKFIRYLAAGSRRKQSTRGRLLLSDNYPTGGYIRPQAQLLDASLKAADQKFEPKISYRPLELEKYPPEIEKLQGDAFNKAKDTFHKKYTHEFRMAGKKGLPWEGYFERPQLVSIDKFPPGKWRVDVEIPSSTDTLHREFMIRQSNPELDNTRPDTKSLYLIASKLGPEVFGNNKELESALQKATSVIGTGPEGKRLAFRFGDEDSLKAIPQCFRPETKTFRNRGAVEDYWDKGITIPSFLTRWASDKPQTLAYGLLLVVGLLSVEWLTRKLLKLA
jgi:hypothetical protein